MVPGHTAVSKRGGLVTRPAPSLVKWGLELFQPLARVRLLMHPAMARGKGAQSASAHQSVGAGRSALSLLSFHLFLSFNLTSLCDLPQREFLVQADLAKQTLLL